MQEQHRDAAMVRQWLAGNPRLPAAIGPAIERLAKLAEGVVSIRTLDLNDGDAVAAVIAETAAHAQMRDR